MSVSSQYFYGKILLVYGLIVRNDSKKPTGLRGLDGLNLLLMLLNWLWSWIYVVVINKSSKITDDPAKVRVA